MLSDKELVREHRKYNTFGNKKAVVAEAIILKKLKQAENLKCCGNCRYWSDLFVNKKCKIRNYPDNVIPSNCCSNWQSDNLTRKEREKNET